MTVTKSEAHAAAEALKHFIGAEQLRVIQAACRGEEGDHFRDKLVEMAEIIERMPGTYDKRAEGKHAPIALHYFSGGSDWWIIEKDAGSPDDEPAEKGKQVQTFGYACLGGDVDNAEFGYISLPELFDNGVELDLYFEPCTVGDVLAKLNGVRRG